MKQYEANKNLSHFIKNILPPEIVVTVKPMSTVENTGVFWPGVATKIIYGLH